MPAFPEAATCEASYQGQDLPGLVQGLHGAAGTVLINAKEEDYPAICDFTGEVAQRLCPCKAKPHWWQESLHDRIVEQVLGHIGDPPAGVGVAAGVAVGQSSADMTLEIEAGKALFVRTAVGESCGEVCQRLGRVCRQKYFRPLNNCDVLRVAFPEGQDCSAYWFGHDLPGLRDYDLTLLVNRSPSNYSSLCWRRHVRTARVCGCAANRSDGGNYDDEQ